ncbi:hypothetical protein ACFOOK_30280 [Micromonospora krabiensis]|uniref:Lipoprotein n=1 Tax=Micromonospora krabiensis TaxID=307121 RepID=A0A1C3N3M2_9ACTN|nr:hypothetical protein [Micromonospora krabiensis]SBV27169.1 hypothetical protein GA0070620_2676 [Micromonospora krabiensis]
MAPVRTGGRTATALLTVLLAVTGCGPVADRTSTDLRAGYDSLDGPLAVWPPRGDLAADAAVTAAVSEAVRAWRSPVDDRVHLPSSGILFAGEVDGSPLALVAADVPGEGASWLLQLTGEDGRYRVARASDYTSPGYLVYSDVLPVQTTAGRRYLTSARVERLLGPDGRALSVRDGLTAPVDVPPCRAVPVTATLRATESLPRGRAADRLLDLGTDTSDPRYPLVRDETGSGRRALSGLDTCVLSGERGPFGSIARRVGDRDAPESVPDSWPLAKVAARSLGEVALGGGEPAELEQLTWESPSGTMTAVVYRPAGGGAPVFSPADRANPLQAYRLPVPGQPLVVLSWRASRDSSLSVPPDTPVLVERPGLAVVPEPERPRTFSVAVTDKTHYRSVGGR